MEPEEQHILSSQVLWGNLSHKDGRLRYNTSEAVYYGFKNHFKLKNLLAQI